MSSIKKQQNNSATSSVPYRIRQVKSFPWSTTSNCDSGSNNDGSKSQIKDITKQHSAVEEDVIVATICYNCIFIDNKNHSKQQTVVVELATAIGVAVVASNNNQKLKVKQQ